jgi:hypothetical protein
MTKREPDLELEFGTFDSDNDSLTNISEKHLYYVWKSLGG